MLSIGALIFPAGGICRVLGASIKMSWADVEMAEGEGEGESLIMPIIRLPIALWPKVGNWPVERVTESPKLSPKLAGLGSDEWLPFPIKLLCYSHCLGSCKIWKILVRPSLSLEEALSYFIWYSLDWLWASAFGKLLLCMKEQHEDGLAPLLRGVFVFFNWIEEPEGILWGCVGILKKLRSDKCRKWGWG